MMSTKTFEQNLACLKQCHPKLAEKILALADVPAVTLSPHQQDEMDLICNFADGSQKSVYGTQGPQWVSDDIIKRLQLKNPRLIVFLGMGLGLHVLQYAHQPHPLNQGIIIVEPQLHFFKKALLLNDFTPLFKNPHVFWLLGQDLTELNLSLVDLFSWGPWIRYANAMEYIPLPGVVQFYKNYFDKFDELIKKAIAYNFNRLFSDPFDAFRGLENIITNIPLLFKMPSLANAKDLFKGKPGVVLASGPSLSLALPYLKQIQDRVMMVACPSALHPLLKAGIEPHIWVNIERGKEQVKLFKQLVEYKTPHYFVAPPLVDQECFDFHDGNNTYLLGGTFQHWLPFPFEAQELGHSSAHAAFLILKYLGCDQIYLFGQDLCYHENHSHAEGAWEDSSKVMMELQNKEDDRLTVEGNNQQKVLSNVLWLTFLKTFGDYLIPNYQGKVYNVIPKNYGAKIQGAERIDYEQFLKNIPQTPTEVLKKINQVMVIPSASDQQKWRKELLLQLDILDEFLADFIGDAQKFAMECKRFAFRSEVIGKKWDLVKEPYQKFLDEVQNYSDRYADPAKAKFKTCYKEILRAVVQGMLLHYQISYFSSATDIDGDFSEIDRKLEIMFHMAKDESFWAMQCRPLFQKLRQNLPLT